MIENYKYAENVYVLTGSFVATSETCDIIARGLRTVQGLVGDSAFSGRGVAGPLNIMTDDSDAEGGAEGQGGGGVRGVAISTQVTVHLPPGPGNVAVATQCEQWRA